MQFLAQTQSAARESAGGNRRVATDNYPPDLDSYPSTASNYLGTGGFASLPHRWSSLPIAAADLTLTRPIGGDLAVPIQSTRLMGQPTQPAVVERSNPTPAVETGTYGPYPVPAAGRHLASVGLGGGGGGAGDAPAGGSGVGSFTGSSSGLLGEFISSLDARTSVGR